MYDLVVCIRCHTHPTLVLDAYDSAIWACNSNTRVVCAVDFNKELADKLSELIGADNVWLSPKRRWWGIGLYSMLLESIEAFSARFKFSHFVSIDYDTLMINKSADTQMLSYVVDSDIGLLGHRQVNNEHWETAFYREKVQIEEKIGTIPDTYMPGEGVQGGCLFLTSSFITALRNRGFFSELLLEASKFTSIADDHFLPIVANVCGMRVEDMSGIISCRWRAVEDPRGMEKKGKFVIHPSKLRPGADNSPADLDVRNYFRAIRGQTVLSTG